MRILKRNAVILTVLLFVCVAVYLNWSYSRGEKEAAAAAAGDVGASAEGASDAGLIYEPEDVLTETAGRGGSSDYFSEARLNRQEARDSAMSILQGTANDEQTSQEQRDEAAACITAMATETLQEAQIENLIIAKGFADCVAFISKDSINVVVPAPLDGLSEASVARIMDVVMTESGITADKIKIVEVK